MEQRQTDLMVADLRPKIRDVIVGPLFSFKVFIGTNDSEKKAIMAHWIDCLEAYTPDEIKAAFIAFSKEGRSFPQPSDIVKICEIAILKKNREILDQVKAEQEMRQYRQPPPDRTRKAEIDRLVKEAFPRNA